MEIYKIILIITIIILLVYFRKFIYNFLPFLTPKTTVNPICNSPDCIDKTKDCGILNSNTLTTCTPPTKGSVDSCYSCYGNMTCQTINNGQTITINKNTPQNDCKYPYVWTDGVCKLTESIDVDLTQQECVSPYIWANGKCKIPDGNYCLPHSMIPLNCNINTGNKVIGKQNAQTPYNWLCMCKDDTKFTNNGNNLSSCDYTRLCSINGNKNSINNSRQLVLKSNSCTSCINYDGTTPKEGDLWNNNSCWDPIECGTCKCGPNEHPNNFNCLPNSCFPCKSHPTDGNKCDCSNVPGYIDCYTATVRDGYNRGVCSIPSSIPDPCHPGGRFDTSNGKCICESPYSAVNVKESAIGQICMDLCKSSKNQCSDRGECYVRDASEYSDGRLNFEFLLITEPVHCYMIKHTITKQYLFIDNNRLKLKSGSGSRFIIMNSNSSCDSINSSCSNVSPLVDKNSYILNYLKTDNDRTMFIKIAQGMMITTINQADATSFKFYSVPNATTTIGQMLISGYNYLGIDITTTGNSTYTPPPPDVISDSITLLTNNVNIPLCKNCKNPYAQSDNGLCSNNCVPSGQWITTGNKFCCAGAHYDNYTASAPTNYDNYWRLRCKDIPSGNINEQNTLSPNYETNRFNLATSVRRNYNTIGAACDAFNSNIDKKGDALCKMYNLSRW